MANVNPPPLAEASVEGEETDGDGIAPDIFTVFKSKDLLKLLDGLSIFMIEWLLKPIRYIDALTAWK
ncbi:MAG: hypothetical protein ACQERW_10270 [Cyanobacteriota bacterium]